MQATINGKSIADTEAHVADICTWQLGGKGIYLFTNLIHYNFFYSNARL